MNGFDGSNGFKNANIFLCCDSVQIDFYYLLERAVGPWYLQRAASMFEMVCVGSENVLPKVFEC